MHLCLILQNELGTLEFIHHIIETFDRYFENVVGELWSLTTSCLAHMLGPT